MDVNGYTVCVFDGCFRCFPMMVHYCCDVFTSKSQALETSQRLLPGGATDHAVRGALFDSHLGGSSGSAPVGFCGDVM